MCDYSLMSFPNRLARPGEELIVHRFPGGSKGLASVSDVPRAAIPTPARSTGFRAILNNIRSLWTEIVGAPEDTTPVPAVCIPPGTRLLLRDIPERLQRQLQVRRVEEVTFTQISAESLSYRDAVRFRNGQEIILQQLREGQRARVFGISLAEEVSPERELLAPAS